MKDALIAAADVYLPARAMADGRWHEAAVQLPEKIVANAVPIPGVNAALANAVGDIPRQAGEARGWDIQKSTTSQYAGRLEKELSHAEVHAGLLNPESKISKQFADAYGEQYDKLKKEAGGSIPGLDRDQFVKDQIRQYMKNMSGPLAASMGGVPSGITRL